MRTLLLLTALLLTLCPAHAQPYGWVDISANVPGDTMFHDLSDLYFISDEEGWITSSSHNEIYHTTDGGQTFEVQTTMLPSNAIWMLNADTGYTGGQSDLIYRTTNGGDTWAFHGTMSSTITDIVFPPIGGTGYACGFNGAISSITAVGVSPMTSGINGDLGSLSFPIDGNEGWVCGVGSIIRHFTGGAWVADQEDITGSWSAIYFIDNQNGWAVGDRITHTTNGLNWNEQMNPDPFPGGRAMLNVFFLDQNDGWIVGNQGLILRTLNGGIDWTLEADGITSSLLTRVQFTSPTNGYIVGNNRTLLKYTLITSTWEGPAEQPVQVLPNPTEGAVRISGLPDGPWQLSVLDLLGREVHRATGAAGGGLLATDIGHLEPGEYLLGIVIGQRQFIQRVIKT